MAAESGRRLDASMTLLIEVMERPLDPGYALAAERRAGGRRPRRGVAAVVALLAMLCGLATTWSVVELRRPAPDAVAARRSLESEIARRVEEADRTQESNMRLQGEIDLARAVTLSGAGASDVAQQVRALAWVAGQATAVGPGLEIVLTDAPDDAAAERGAVLDRDIQIVVNALWAAGAEAIAVNGRRLTAVSAIRRAGQAVLVDLQPLIPPYRIAAIGDPQALDRAMSDGVGGAYLTVLRRDGIRSEVATRATLELSGGGDTVDLVHARPVGPAVEVRE
jgi:uncharacterized protein YlxW (UPF0749 family)